MFLSALRRSAAGNGIEGGGSTTGNIVRDYARRMRLKHDPLIQQIQQSPKRVPRYNLSSSTSSSSTMTTPAGDQQKEEEEDDMEGYKIRIRSMASRRREYGSDQMITPAIFRNGSSSSSSGSARSKHCGRRLPDNSNVWSKQEDVELLKAVIGQVVGQPINKLPTGVIAQEEGLEKREDGDEMEIEMASRLPDRIDDSEIDWKDVAGRLDCRTAYDCRRRLKALVQPYRRKRFDVEAKMFVDDWTDDQLQRLRLGRLRFTTGGHDVNWLKLSLYVGKTRMHCKRKLIEIEASGGVVSI